MLKLAYIEYPYKMSLSAMKQFKDKTGCDMWNILWGFVNAYRGSEGQDQFKRLEALTEVCDFFTASELFHALFYDQNSCVSIEEVQDGMYRVSGRPNPDDDECSHPWPLVMVMLAYEVDDYFSKNIDQSKKKADSSEGSQETKA